ncbi:MAG: MurR/RpiR family transcriptional regulator, partial [Kiritimatiellae bacterium]|nr:MurR/RpiR family transcriptional regulator [Kiritimatiellia bacterium]
MKRCKEISGMGGGLARLASLRRELTGAEARVADHIESHAADVPYASVNALAGAAGVSVASVTRLAKRLGYAGLKDLKIALAQEVSSPVSAIYEAIGERDSDDEVVRKVFGGNVQSLQKTLTMLDTAACAKAAGVLARSRRVMFFGIGTSGNVGRDAALRLSHLGVNAEAHGDSYSMLIHSMHMQKGDVAVGISHSGRSAMTVEALAAAKAGGATTIGISNFMSSPLHR